MIRLRCERQSIALLSTMALFGVANLVFLVAVIHLTGAVGVFGVMIAVMAFYVFNSARGTLEALSVYSYDDETIERAHPIRRLRMRWSEVRDFRIRRSSGDASVFLVDGGGRQLRLDFQLLGDAGADLMRVMFRRLHPLVESKLGALHREARVFPRRHVGFVPVPGSVTAGAGIIKGAGPAITLQRVSEISVKEVRKLTATQEYTVHSPEGQVRFLSFVDDSPLLLKYLRAVVPEERWTIARTSGVFVAKVTSLILVPVMAWSALVVLAGEAGSIATHRALAQRAQEAPAIVESVERVGERRSRLSYSFDAGGERMYGTVLAGGNPPEPGRPLIVRYDPQQPWINLPAAGQGVDLPSVWTVLGPALVMLLLSLPYAAATLFYSVRRDPFEDWIAGAPSATAAGAGA